MLVAGSEHQPKLSCLQRRTAQRMVDNRFPEHTIVKIARSLGHCDGRIAVTQQRLWLSLDSPSSAQMPRTKGEIDQDAAEGRRLRRG